MTVGTDWRYAGVLWPELVEHVGMPLLDSRIQTVAFIVGLRRDANGQEMRTPIGTGFAVSVPEQTVDGELWSRYIVTAAHCVRTEAETWVRVPTGESEVEDLPVAAGGWHSHWHDDVAVASIDVLRTQRAIRVDQWADDPHDVPASIWKERGPLLGDRVYFAGLLTQVPEMGKRNLPMVRSGTLGALQQERVPVVISRDPLHVEEGTYHLIDCRSFAGFSGSPCFIQFDAINPPGGAVSVDYLFGVLVAHIEATNDEGERANAGVGAVVPIEKVRELLMSKDVRDERMRIVERHSRTVTEHGAAVPDSIEIDNDYTREDFLRDLTKVTRPVEEPDSETS